MKRRELLQQLAVAGAVLAPPMASSAKSDSDKLGPVLPVRTLGKSGEKITCLGLGGSHASWPKNETVIQATIEKAMEVGIRFFDTAEFYGKGRSEEMYGKYLIPKYRDHIYLMTKTMAKDADTARGHLEGSLKRMNTDVIDLWQLHSLESKKDTDNRLEKGVLDVAIQAQKEGKVRHIGFTGHASAEALARMTENETARKNCTACQMIINPVDAASKHSFINEAMPKMLDSGIGILAMKTLAAGRFFSQQNWHGKVSWTSDNPIIPDIMSLDECISFSLSLPVSTLITGAERPELVEEKAAIVRKFSKLSADDRKVLIDKVADFADQREIEFYKR